MGRLILEGNFDDGRDVYKYEPHQKTELTRIHDLFDIGKSDVWVFPYGAQINDINILTLTGKEVSELKSRIEIKKNLKIRGYGRHFWNMCDAIVEYAEDFPQSKYRFLSEN